MKSKMIKRLQNKTAILDVPLANDITHYTGLHVHMFPKGGRLEGTVKDDEELCIVIVSGYVDATIGNEKFSNIGNRMSPFVDDAPYAFYVTAGDTFDVQSLTDSEIAMCVSIGKGTYPSRLIEPKPENVEHRGYGQIKRTAKNILPETENADSLLVVEVITEGGNWSSFPSHRHDEDNLPEQSYLEEIYYHRLNPSRGGFALQRVYNDDKSVNDTYSIEDQCAVLVTEGYHPVAVPPGYTLYYLNVMAGPTRTWKFYNDPFFEHLIQ